MSNFNLERRKSNKEPKLASLTNFNLEKIKIDKELKLAIKKSIINSEVDRINNKYKLKRLDLNLEDKLIKEFGSKLKRLDFNLEKLMNKKN